MADRASLAERYRRCDRDAFEELYRMYEQAVYGYIRVRVPRDEDAQDLAQETWVQLWEKRGSYDPKYSFFTWARYWASVNILRYYDRKRPVPIAELFGRFPELEDEEEVQDAVDRLVAGQESWMDPSEDWEMLTRLLYLTFERGGYPWELIAFGFNKLIGGWRPRFIVEKLSEVVMRKLARMLEESYVVGSSVALPEEVHRCFEPLHSKMGCKVGEVLDPSDVTSVRRLKRILQELVGRTVLRNYYGRNPEANISDWSDKVRRKVLRAVLEDEDLLRFFCHGPDGGHEKTGDRA